MKTLKRREFIKIAPVAAGLAATLNLRPSLKGAESISSEPPAQSVGENRSADFLRRVRSEQLLPKPPQLVNVAIPPMGLEERVRRKIVPRRGYCSLTPASGALLCGNGAVTIELDGDPFA